MAPGWASGPCLALSQGSPLSEDLLKYVPREGQGELPVTTAINIAQEQKESEVDRKLKAHEPSHQFFVDLVTLEGELKMRNYEKTAITVIVTAPVAGKPLSASHDGIVSLKTTKLQLLERAGTVQWKLKLEPGETKAVTYRYERYVPSR